MKFWSLLSLYLSTNADVIDNFIALPRALSIRSYLQNLTANVHVAGTQGNEDTANYVRTGFEDAGLEVEWHTFDSLLTYPLEHAVSLTFPPDQAYNCSLKEPNVTGDPSTYYDAPTHHGYAASGDVEAELVYANYGMIDDFDYLESQNISVAGKIVIVRYGLNFRGVKVYLAQMRGAVGVLIYSDPIDDGEGRGLPYPQGPWRPQWGVQRGSVQFLNICPGDPRRVGECLNDQTANYSGSLIPNIPVHPLSWGDATFLLAQLNSSNPIPKYWQGGIPGLQYAIGPGPARVKMHIKQNFTVRSLINVCGTIPGTAPGEGAVIMGNHRDAWVYGAADPSSGTAILMEMVKAFGVLLKSKWRPRRSIVICSWDGEEYALLGSTNWTASHPALVSGAVAYLNVDIGVSGVNFSASASPSLTTAINTATARVPDPGAHVPLGSPWPRVQAAPGSAWGGWPGQLGVLGSGSDYTSFLHRWGVPSATMTFDGNYGVYHSVYDSFKWMDVWGDNGFVYSEALTKLWGALALVLSEPERVPLNYTDTASALHTYFAYVNQTIQPQLDLSGLHASITGYSSSALKLTSLTTDVVNSVNRRAERNFLIAQGLPARPYFKHVLQAPGINLGYGSDVFPGLTEAIRDKNWTRAQQQADVLATVIQTAAAALEVAPAPEGNGPDPLLIVGICIGVVALIVVAGCFFRRRQVQSKGYSPIE